MSTLRVIKRRIRSVHSTQQITRAMEMVAAARLMRARRDAESARPYAETMARMLAHLAAAAGNLQHPLFEPRDEGPRVLVVFSSDRGLCGAFNTNLTRRAAQFVDAHAPGGGVRMIFVGRKSWDHFRRRDYDIVQRYGGHSSKAELGLARQVTEQVLDLFEAGGARSVHLLYTRFVSTVTRTVVVEKLLNIEPPASEPAPAAGASGQLDYIFEPSPERIFHELLPRYALTRVMSALLESFASEHSARMVAMSSATSNAEEMIDSLVLQRNRMRQAIITREIAELVGGAEALA